MRKVIVRQFGSSIRRHWRQDLYLKSLGLGKIGKQKVLTDSPSVRALIRRLSHMVEVLESGQNAC